MQVFKLSVIVSLLAVASSIGYSCPSQENLMPCTCKRVAIGLYVVCANFDDSEELIKAFKVLRDHKVTNVVLHGLHLKDVLPSDIFHGLQISQLRVEKSNLKFPEPAFTGLNESLHVLNVAQYSLIKSSEDFSLAKLPMLSELNIKSNRIGKVKNQWLNGKIPNVHTVKLDEDDIFELENKAFAGLTHVKIISLANNRIKSISRSMFPRPANNLARLDLSYNEISSLPFDMFFQMEKLTEVILSGNDLQTLPQMIWSPIWDNLKTLMLLENRMSCDEKLDWIKKAGHPYKFEGMCMAPEDMEGKSLTEVFNT